LASTRSQCSSALEPGALMLWGKPGGTWLWLLKPVGAGHMRLIIRLRSRCAWAKPIIVTELILMEIGDPFLMRKCLLGIRQRAEQLAAGRYQQAEARAAGRKQPAAGAGAGAGAGDNGSRRAE
jgi:hypothetical protein